MGDKNSESEKCSEIGGLVWMWEWGVREVRAVSVFQKIYVLSLYGVKEYP